MGSQGTPVVATSGLGVAVLGLGRIGPAHVRAVSQTAGARLVAIADVDETKRTATVAELRYEGVTGVADYRDALARPDVEAVVIALPHWLHAQAAIDAANAHIAPARAGCAAGLIQGIEPAGEIVQRIVAEAERILRERPAQLVR